MGLTTIGWKNERGWPTFYPSALIAEAVLLFTAPTHRHGKTQMQLITI